MNHELADFLRRARSARDPVAAGLPADGRVRRVPGLRREEVALLAGVSADYYARLEQGRRIVPSPAVVDGIARALALEPAGRAHLERLIAQPARRGRRSAPVQRVRPGLRQLLDSLVGQPALVLGRRTDVLACNRMAAALLTDFDRLAPRQRNYARWMFGSAEARELLVDWEVQARAVVENLRLDDPDDAASADLIAELTAASPEFARWWEEHRVHQRTFGTKHFRHPVVGDLSVAYETFTLPGDADQTLFVYSTEPGSPSSEAMALLASWVEVRG